LEELIAHPRAKLELVARMTQKSLDKGKIKILLLEGVHSTTVEAFRRTAT